MPARGALFGARGRGPTNRQDKLYAEKSEQMFEQQNDELVDQLGSKVDLLRSLTIEIGGEINDQKDILGNVGDGLDFSSGLLKGTMARLARMEAMGSSKQIAYIVAFIVSVFLLVYYVLL
mmetsp:Transcript_4037/g.4658  ORF Transcript_4037/g.4658 Transcript_4037/m.4658 type:complete len:120 (+) Transcript_4037:34-393(+)